MEIKLLPPDFRCYSENAPNAILTEALLQILPELTVLPNHLAGFKGVYV